LISVKRTEPTAHRVHAATGSAWRTQSNNNLTFRYFLLATLFGLLRLVRYRRTHLAEAKQPKGARTVKQPASDRQSGGGEEDGVLKLMRRYGIPITRQNYLDFAYMGEVPAR